MDINPIRFPPSPRLPPEVMSLIFACLPDNNDWATLRVCSRLSRQCLRQSRKILFNKISLRIRIDSKPKPVLVTHVFRRIQGLCDMFQRDPETARSVKELELLDSYPVYKSTWIITNQNLPRLLTMLVGLRSFTFGCEVGYLQWPSLNVELQIALVRTFHIPHLESLDIRNVGNISPNRLNTSVRHLSLDSISLMLPYPRLDLCDAVYMTLSTLNLRTISTSTATSAWHVIIMHCRSVESIQWRCWEDPRMEDGVSFISSINFGYFPYLTKLSIRMSYGNVGRDLSGLCHALESISYPSPLEILELHILFPLQVAPDYTSDVHKHIFWSHLSFALLRKEYHALSQVRMDLTVHDQATTRGDRSHNSITGFRTRMKESLKSVLSISTFSFSFKVRAFSVTKK